MKRLATADLPALLLLCSCLSGRPITAPDSSPSSNARLGSFAITSQVLGSEAVQPTACTAGDSQHFLGFDLSSGASPVVVRLAVDPVDGPAVRVFSSDAPFDKAVVFRRTDCRVFHFSLDSTGWRVNDIYDYRVSLELDCSRAGESIHGSASSTHCH